MLCSAVQGSKHETKKKKKKNYWLLLPFSFSGTDLIRDAHEVTAPGFGPDGAAGPWALSALSAFSAPWALPAL